MRLLTRSPQGEGVPKSHLKWECDSKSNIIARFTPSPHQRIDEYSNYISRIYTFKLEILSIGPSTIVPPTRPCPNGPLRPYGPWLPNCLKFIHLYWYTWCDMCDIYISDSDTCHTFSVTCHAASGGKKGGNMKSLMIKKMSFSTLIRLMNLMWGLNVKIFISSRYLYPPSIQILAWQDLLDLKDSKKTTSRLQSQENTFASFPSNLIAFIP